MQRHDPARLTHFLGKSMARQFPCPPRPNRPVRTARPVTGHETYFRMFGTFFRNNIENYKKLRKEATCHIGINNIPSVPDCKVYSFLARILRHGNFVHGEIISYGENWGRRVPNRYNLKTIRQISMWRDLTRLWSGNIV